MCPHLGQIRGERIVNTSVCQGFCLLLLIYLYILFYFFQASKSFRTMAKNTTFTHLIQTLHCWLRGYSPLLGLPVQFQIFTSFWRTKLCQLLLLHWTVHKTSKVTFCLDAFFFFLKGCVIVAGLLKAHQGSHCWWIPNLHFMTKKKKPFKMILFYLSLFLSSSACFIHFLLLAAEVFSILNDMG